MDQLRKVISGMIDIRPDELERLVQQCSLRTFQRKEVLSAPGKIPDEIFFIKNGIIRVTVADKAGETHTIHFALANQFIADYSSFILRQSSLYTLEAIQTTETVVMPRSAVEWGYANLQQGDRLGRLVAEYYFIYQDNRIKNLYARTPRERYDLMSDIFPDIHNLAPQHMIASYLGITPVHLSRLKKEKP